MESPATSPAAAPAERECALSQVDPFLVEVLQNPRHRLTVLRMELDIQKFIQNVDQCQFEFQHFPTSYLRRAAHLVAQHYGLQTMALGNIVNGLGSRVIARKTPGNRFPAICLSEIPAKHPENEIGEKVKIAIRRRPCSALSSDAIGLGKTSFTRTVEERKEEYDKARARIFNGHSSPEREGSPSMPSANGRNSCSNGDEHEFYRMVEETESMSTKDGASRVAVFRDREKDRSDPDYDRSYDRYVRGLTPSQALCLGSCNVLQPPFLPYEGAFLQTSHLPMNQTSVSYMPSNLILNPFCAFGSNQTSKDTVFMQWSNPTLMYTHPYEHSRHAVFQAPFYQQHMSFEHPQNC